MEQQVKTKVQFTDNYNAFTNLENNDGLSTGFGKIHYDLGYLNSEDQRQESEINAIAQVGSKNICPIGTETHSSEIGFGTEYSFPMPEGAYIISFTGTMVAPIQFNVYSESGTRIALVDIHTIQEAEAGIRFVLNDNATKCKFWYDTSDNYTLSNIMIRDANITDNTFQPYSPTNRQLYDLVNEKQNSLTFDGTYDSDLNPVATVSTVSNSINDLDVSSVGGSGKYISEISETDGKIEATAETMDTVPTSGSTKAVSSGGVWTPLIELVDGVAKNLFNYDVLGPNSSNIGTSVVVNGVRFTMNSDKSVTITRESSSSQAAYIWFRHRDGSAVVVTDFCDDNHVFSGAAGGSVSTYILYINNMTGSNTYKYFGEGGIIGTPQVTPNAAGISIAAGYSPSNLVIKPMICTKAEWDVSHQFVPYALSNPVITPALIEQVDNGGKNIADMSKSSFTTLKKDSVTVTLSGDTITASGTGGTSANNFFNIYYQPDTLLIPAGTWVALLHGTGTGNFRIEEYDDVNGTAIKGEFGEPFTFTIPENATLSYIRIVSKPSTNCAGTFKLMICTLADWNVSQKYVPYCPSLPDIFKWDEYECLYTSSQSVIAKLNTTTSSVKVRINKALRRVVIYFNLVFISDFIYGTDGAFGFGTITNIPNYSSFYPFTAARTHSITADYDVTITKNNTNATIVLTCTSGRISTGTTLTGQFEYTY